jgi:general stress protein 26
MNATLQKLTRLLYLSFIILLLAPGVAVCQEKEQADPPRSRLMEAAREIMNSANTCALITLDREGRPRVRAMDAFLPEEDFTVWMGTNSSSRKVDQIKNDPRVTLYYLEGGDSGYVMIHGKAYLVDDKEEKEKRWKPEWEAFYPADRKGYLLIKIIPDWMEVVSYSHGLIGDPDTWEPPKVMFDSK